MEFLVFDQKKILGNRISSILLGVLIIFTMIVLFEHFNIYLNLKYNIALFMVAVLSISIKSKIFFGSIGKIVFNNDSIDLRVKGKENIRYFLSKKTYAKLRYTKQSNFTFSRSVELLINGENQTIFFYIKGKTQKKEFIRIIEQYYMNRYNFDEIEELGEKVFLTQANLNYSEIQKIKEKYNRSWI